MTTLGPTSFYWHDYETFGLRTDKDRPAQFAGVRTTLDLEQVGDFNMWYCKPATDAMPNPEACMVTGITPQECHEKGLSEVDFATRIHDEFNKQGTVSIGYNVFGFDDKVSRFLFWRNLKDVYSREYANGCSCWDIFHITRMVWALRGKTIKWPLHDDSGSEMYGQVKFSLEAIAKANNLPQGEHAHDAGADVEATLSLARLLAREEPRLWKWAFENRSKAKIIEALNSGKVCVWGDMGGSPKLYGNVACGQDQGFMRFVLPISPDREYKNETYVWDCRYDPEILRGLGAQEIMERGLSFPTSAKLKEKGEDFRLPIFKLVINKSPFVCSDIRIVNDKVADRFGINIEEIQKNAEKFIEIQKEIISTFTSAVELLKETRTSEVPDVDQALYYGSLPCFSDKKSMSAIHKKSPESIAANYADGKHTFEDSRYGELLFRLRGRNWPETLTKEELDRWVMHCGEAIHSESEKEHWIKEYRKFLEKKDTGKTKEQIDEEVDYLKTLSTAEVYREYLFVLRKLTKRRLNTLDPNTQTEDIEKCTRQLETLEKLKAWQSSVEAYLESGVQGELNDREDDEETPPEE